MNNFLKISKSAAKHIRKIMEEEGRKWDRDWHGENEMKMSINDQRHVDISTLGYLLKMHSQKKYK